MTATKNKVDQALGFLEQAAERSSKLLVSYSGGKDSRVVLDLAHRVFKPENISAYFMYFLPGLRCVQEGLDWARQRYGTKIIEVPHWNVIRMMTDGIYGPEREVTPIKEGQLRAIVRQEAGASIIATGEKKCDGGLRRNIQPVGPGVVRPLHFWNKFDLISYMRVRGIPMPNQQKGNSGGVGLDTVCVLWLYDNWPEDYQAIERVFPYVGAIVKRREWYGIETEQRG